MRVTPQNQVYADRGAADAMKPPDKGRHSGSGGLISDRFPVPRQQLVDPVDLVIVDAVEDIGEVGWRIEAVELGGLNYGHGAGKGFATGVRTGEEEVFAADHDRFDGAFGGIVVDGDAAVVEEEGEGVPAVQSLAESLGKIAFAGDSSKLCP